MAANEKTIMDHDSHTYDYIEPLLHLDLKDASEFTDILTVAANLCEVSAALIMLFDTEKNWVLASNEADFHPLPADNSFLHAGWKRDELIVISTVPPDSGFAQNLVINKGLKVQFFAGAPLVIGDGTVIGALCVFDYKSGEVTSLQRQAITVLSRQVLTIIELKRSQKQLRLQVEEIQSKNATLKKIAQMQSHDIRQPLTAIMGLINLIHDCQAPVDDEWMILMRKAVANLDQKIRSIVAATMADKDIKMLQFNKVVEEIDSYAILLLDKEGTIENWNRGAEKIKGYRAFEMIGKNFSTFYTPEDRMKRRPEKLLMEATATGFAKDEGWRVRKNGTRFWGSILITAIHNDKGEVIGFTKVTRDLTNSQDRQVLSAIK